MLTESDKDLILDQAVLAGAEVIEDSTDDDIERSMLATVLAGGLFCSALSDASQDEAEVIARRINAGLQSEGSPWRLVRSE